MRRNPHILIPELEDLIDNRNKYYSKYRILLEAIGDNELEEAVSIALSMCIRGCWCSHITYNMLRAVEFNRLAI
jgi:hypothetical protein